MADDGTPRGSATPVPTAFRKLFYEKVDFDAAFAALEPSDHFYCVGLRGRIRSMQLRIEEAWELLDAAREKSFFSEGSLEDLLRRLIIDIYRLVNAITEQPPVVSEPLPDWLDQLPGEISMVHPDPIEALRVLSGNDARLRNVLAFRRRVEAMLRLSVGEPEKALEIMERLVEEERSEITATLGVTYVGLAAARHNTGDRDGAIRAMEDAGFTARSNIDTLGQLRIATLLSVFYEFVEMHEEAADWRETSHRLDVPAATLEIFSKRAQLVKDRCVESDALIYL